MIDSYVGGPEFSSVKRHFPVLPSHGGKVGLMETEKLDFVYRRYTAPKIRNPIRKSQSSAHDTRSTFLVTTLTLYRAQTETRGNSTFEPYRAIGGYIKNALYKTISICLCCKSRSTYSHITVYGWCSIYGVIWLLFFFLFTEDTRFCAQ